MVEYEDNEREVEPHDTNVLPHSYMADDIEKLFPRVVPEAAKPGEDDIDAHEGLGDPVPAIQAREGRASRGRTEKKQTINHSIHVAIILKHSAHSMNGWMSSRGAAIDTQDSDGNTALIVVAREGHRAGVLGDQPRSARVLPL